MLEGWERDLYERVHATVPGTQAPPVRVGRERTTATSSTSAAAILAEAAPR